MRNENSQILIYLYKKHLLREENERRRKEVLLYGLEKAMGGKKLVITNEKT